MRTGTRRCRKGWGWVGRGANFFKSFQQFFINLDTARLLGQILKVKTLNILTTDFNILALLYKVILHLNFIYYAICLCKSKYYRDGAFMQGVPHWKLKSSFWKGKEFILDHEASVTFWDMLGIITSQNKTNGTKMF